MRRASRSILRLYLVLAIGGQLHMGRSLLRAWLMCPRHFRNLPQTLLHQFALSIFLATPIFASPATIINFPLIAAEQVQTMNTKKEKTNQLVDLKEQDCKAKLECLNQGGQRLLAGGFLPEAMVFFQRVLKIQREIGDRAGEYVTLSEIGEIYRRLRQYSNALETYQVASVVARQIGDRAREGSTLTGIGSVYRDEQKFDKALEFYKQALVIHRELRNYAQEATVLYQMGEVSAAMGQFSMALETYQQASAIRTALSTGATEQNENHNLRLIEIYNGIGEIYTEQAQYLKALEFFRKAQSLSDTWSHHRTHINLGRVHTRLGNYPDALKAFNKFIQDLPPSTSYQVVFRRGCLAFGSDDRQGATVVEDLQTSKGVRLECATQLALAFAGKAEVYLKLGEYSQSLDYYQYALKLFQGVTPNGYAVNLIDQSQQAVVLNNIGVVYKSQGQYESALNFYQQALLIHQELKDQLGAAISLNNIGEIHRNLGQYSDALRAYEQALGIFDQLYRSKFSLSRVLSTFDGSVGVMIRSDATQTSKLSTLRSQYSSNLKVVQGQASVLHNQGVIYDELGESEKAFNLYLSALATRNEINDISGAGATLNNMGLVHSSKGRYDLALKQYQQALEKRRQANDRPGEATTLNNIALVYERLGKPSQAIEPLQQALMIFRVLGDRAGEGNTLDSLGTIYKSLGQFGRASEAYQQSLGILRQIGNRPIECVTLSNMGDLFKQQQQPELAIAFYKQSVNVTESIRKDNQKLTPDLQASYTKTIAGTYRALADLLISQGRLSEGQRVLELLKVQEIRDFTRSDANLDKQQIALLTLEKEILAQHTTLIAFGQKLLECEQTKQNCKTLRDQLDQNTIAFNNQSSQFQKELRQRLASDPAFLTSDQLSGVASDIINAQPGSALIYPLILDNKIRLLLAVKAGTQGVIFRTVEVPNVGQKQLWDKVNQLHNHLKTPTSDLTELQTTSAELYDWLIRPLEPELKTGKITSLVFSLDRATRYIPMAVLYDKERKQYLTQQYPTSTILSAELTKMDSKLGTPSQVKILGLGLSNPIGGFSALNSVPSELAAIVRQPNQPQTKGIYNGQELLNQAFDLTSLRDNLQGQNILHIATHGSFEPGNPANSFILSGTGDKLTIDKLKTLSNYMRDIHLVVLSACQTAVGGPDESGIEVPGISFYFLQNKAKAVLASLWLVNDASTALMMQQFYTHLATGKTKAQALQQVQQDFLLGKLKLKDAEAIDRAGGRRQIKGQLPADSFAHPYYWAPFILIGNSL